MGVRYVTVGVAGFLLGLSVAGCRETSSHPGSGVISEAAILEQVQKATGKRLVRAEGGTAFHVLDLGPRIGRDCNGCFRIIVADSWDVAWRAVVEGSRVDGRGIYWQRLDVRPPYEAMTMYGHRIFLFWRSSRMGRTDARWARLDRYLSRLARRNACRGCLRAMSFSTQFWSYRTKPPFRRSLGTRKEKQEYDDAFYACDPAEHVAGGELETAIPRKRLIADIAAIYSGSDTNPSAIANGVAKAYARIGDNQFEHTARAKQIWRRACLDALIAR